MLDGLNQLVWDATFSHGIIWASLNIANFKTQVGIKLLHVLKPHFILIFWQKVEKQVHSKGFFEQIPTGSNILATGAINRDTILIFLWAHTVPIITEKHAASIIHTEPWIKNKITWLKCWHTLRWRWNNRACRSPSRGCMIIAGFIGKCTLFRLSHKERSTIYVSKTSNTCFRKIWSLHEANADRIFNPSSPDTKAEGMVIKWPWPSFFMMTVGLLVVSLS